MSNLLMPVTPQGSASWASHTRRSPRSSEPGTDMFVPIGTPVLAPGDGVIYGSGNTIKPATGRWNGIDLDDGMRWRGMHYSRLVRTSGRVRRGEVIAYSGASGYGYEDWSRVSGMPGAHVHVTLWPTHSSRFGYDANGRPYTVDFMNYVGGASGGSGSGEWDEMATKAEVQQAVADALASTRYGEGNRNLFDLGNDARGFALRAATAAEAGTADKVWSHAVASQDAQGRVLDRKYPAAGYLASTNARVGVSPEQVKTIADAVVKQIGSPTVSIDYEAIADAVNDEAAKRLAG